VLHARFALAVVFLALLAAAPASAQAAPRVVSLNMCTDQLLVDFADPEQVLGLSPFAHDMARSWAVARTRAYPALSGTAEEVLALRPDLVVAGPQRRATREMLAAHGFRVEQFTFVRSLAEARQQMARMGAVLGHPERAAARIAALDAAVERARTAAAGRRLRVLPLARRGWVSGEDSLITSLLDAVGLVNAARELGVGAGRQLTLETIVALRPDFLLVSREGGTVEDQGRAFLEHPALTATMPPSRRIVVPERLTVCGGPMLVEALDRLTGEIRRLGL
jgi:iron complex transport system substrate-binding protein